MEKEKWLTLAEIAMELRVDRKTVYRYVWKGYLPAYKLDRVYRVKREDFERFLDERRKRND